MTADAIPPDCLTAGIHPLPPDRQDDKRLHEMLAPLRDALQRNLGAEGNGLFSLRSARQVLFVVECRMVVSWKFSITRCRLDDRDAGDAPLITGTTELDDLENAMLGQCAGFTAADIPCPCSTPSRVQMFSRRWRMARTHRADAASGGGEPLPDPAAGGNACTHGNGNGGQPTEPRSAISALGQNSEPTLHESRLYCNVEYACSLVGNDAVPFSSSLDDNTWQAAASVPTGEREKLQTFVQQRSGYSLSFFLVDQEFSFQFVEGNQPDFADLVQRKADEYHLRQARGNLERLSCTGPLSPFYGRLARQCLTAPALSHTGKMRFYNELKQYASDHAALRRDILFWGRARCSLLALLTVACLACGLRAFFPAYAELTRYMGIPQSLAAILLFHLFCRNLRNEEGKQKNTGRDALFNFAVAWFSFWL